MVTAPASLRLVDGGETRPLPGSYLRSIVGEGKSWCARGAPEPCVHGAFALPAVKQLDPKRRNPKPGNSPRNWIH